MIDDGYCHDLTHLLDIMIGADFVSINGRVVQRPEGVGVTHWLEWWERALKAQRCG